MFIHLHIQFLFEFFNKFTFPLEFSTLFIISMFCLAFLQITNLFLRFLKIKTFHKMLLYNISFRCIKSHILFIRLFVLAYFLCPIQIWSV